MEINIQTLWDWIRKEKELKGRNWQGLLRGRKEGEMRILKSEQEISLKRIILETTPEKIGLGSALWTRRIIQKLIKQETKKDFPINTVGNQLQRWGLTPQRPGKVANEQDLKKIQDWIEKDFVRIQKQAKTEDAIIKFSDESGISLNTYYGRSYAEKGHTPNIKLPATRSHISLISSISNGGKNEFMLYKKGLDSETFLIFLQRQIQYSTKKIYLIVDNLRVHKSKIVMEWIDKHSDKIALFFPTSIRSSIQPSRIFKQYLETLPAS